MNDFSLENTASLKKMGRKPKPHLKIAVDCGSLSASTISERGGVATVTQQLLEQLAELDAKNEYWLYSFAPLSKKLISHFKGRAKNSVLPKFGFNRIWMPLKFFTDKPDVFLATSQTAVKTDTPTLGFIYDVAFLKYPKLYARAEKLMHNTSQLVMQAKHIITISESSKEDILEKYKLHYRKITVLYPGVSDIFKPLGPKFVNIRPYFLYVGVIKKTKNIEILLAGFAKYAETSSYKYRLVLVGKNEMKNKLNQMIQKLGIEADVTVKGYVATSDLPKYYRGAVAFISPAIYEGFGLPLVEAMACGIPVIAGKNSAMIEVVGKAGILVNETKSIDLAQALSLIQSDKKIVQKFKRLGFGQIKMFDKRKFARGVLDAVYKYCV